MGDLSELRARDAGRREGAVPVEQGIVYVRELDGGKVELTVETLQLRNVTIVLTSNEADAVARRLSPIAAFDALVGTKPKSPAARPATVVSKIREQQP